MTTDLEQRSPEWFAARCGSLGASCVHEVVARTKTGWSASRANRMAALVLERITGTPQDTYVSREMQEGIEREPEARAAYQFETTTLVKQVGLVPHPKIACTHASPDGLIGEDGLVEIKCPQAAAHLAVLTGEDIPARYFSQMQWQMACTGRTWCDFVSYHPMFPEAMRLMIQRVERNAAQILDLESAVIVFLKEVDAKVAALTERYGEREAA